MKRTPVDKGVLMLYILDEYVYTLLPKKKVTFWAVVFHANKEQCFVALG